MNQLKIAIKLFAFMTLLTGVAYPLLIATIAQLAMPSLANGSLLHTKGRVVGSSLIAQKTTDDGYFWPRPSAIDYNPIAPSGGSNLGPTSRKLKDEVAERKNRLGHQAPAELLYASGSGLDPHISLEAAYFQIARIAKARSITEKELKNLIDHSAEGGLFGIGGKRYINVLKLNEKLSSQ